MPRTDRAPRTRLATDERRAAILDAARSHYAEWSFADSSVSAIARAAGGSPALVFHYFGSKAGLYAAVVADALAHLDADRRAADAALAAGVPVRDRVRAWVLTYLDHVAARPLLWTAPLMGGEEPPEAAAIRVGQRELDVVELAARLRPTGGVRHEFALWGFFGFVDAACARWVDTGCPDDARHPLAEAALGALQGALGDWGR